MTRLLHLGALAALLLASLALVGCGGGGGNDGEINPPPTDQVGSLGGRVVQADNVNVGLAGATVVVRNAGGDVIANGLTDSQGNFIILSVPVGASTLEVETPSEAVYASQTVPGVVIANNTRTNLTITVLRNVDPAPTQVTLSPASATVDVHGQVDFDAEVVSGGTIMAVTPVFLVSANIGVIDRNGVFTSTQPGTGTVTAISGGMSDTAIVTVTGSRAPEITSFLVGPRAFGASGGWVYVTAAANDGDGIASVQAEIFYPDASVISRDMTFNPASTDTYQLFSQTNSGTRLGYRIPANSNQPNSNGIQAPQEYSIRVVVKDNANQTTVTDVVQVMVAGLDAPPPPQ